MHCPNPVPNHGINRLPSVHSCKSIYVYQSCSQRLERIPAYKGYSTFNIGYLDRVYVSNATPSSLQNYLDCDLRQYESIHFFLALVGCEGQADRGKSPMANESTVFNGPLISFQDGCLGNWTFADEGAIFMDNITSTWSGTIIGSWDGFLAAYDSSQNASSGEAQLSFPQFNASGDSVVPTLLTPDVALEGQWATIRPTGTTLGRFHQTPPVPS
jgi:hypothetical protein